MEALRQCLERATFSEEGGAEGEASERGRKRTRPKPPPPGLPPQLLEAASGW